MNQKQNDGVSWHACLEQVRVAGERVYAMLPAEDYRLPNPEVDRVLAMTFAQAYWMLFHGDAGHPEWVPFISPLIPSGAINPDTLYYTCRIDPAGTYRLSGTRGTSRLLDFQLNQRQPGSDQLSGARTGSIDGDSLALDADGRFEVIMSPERPADYAGNWRPLPPETGSILMRQVSYDWENEIDARVAIERLDLPVGRPRFDPQDIEQRMQRFGSFIANYQRQFLGYKGKVRELGPPNILHTRVRAEKGGEGQGGGMGGQIIYHGNFNLAEDEGLLIETAIPERCYYWNIQITDELHLALEPMTHQTSLNGFQARLDSDGKFRAVIALRDPGIPNWLDTAGYLHGGIMGRWTRASAAPVPATRVVKLADLRKLLPADTPVITPEDRERLVRARCRAMQKRRR